MRLRAHPAPGRAAPAACQDNPPAPPPAPNHPLQALKTHVAQQLSDNLHHAAAAASGAAWVRGWDDGSRAAGGGAGGEAHTAGVDK